jgi:hypothetical protein
MTWTVVVEVLRAVEKEDSAHLPGHRVVNPMEAQTPGIIWLGSDDGGSGWGEVLDEDYGDRAWRRVRLSDVAAERRGGGTGGRPSKVPARAGSGAVCRGIESRHGDDGRVPPAPVPLEVAQAVPDRGGAVRQTQGLQRRGVARQGSPVDPSHWMGVGRIRRIRLGQ